MFRSIMILLLLGAYRGSGLQSRVAIHIRKEGEF